MGKIEIKYLVPKRVNGKYIYYWQPKSHYVVNGKLVKCPLPSRRVAKATNDPIEAAEEAQKLNEHLDKWHKGFDVSIVQSGTVGYLIVQYKKDTRFKGLRDSTRALYEHLLAQINEHFGDVPQDKVSKKAARSFCVSFQDNPRKPSLMASMGRTLYNFAKLTDDTIKYNPFDELGIEKPKARTQVWSGDMIKAVHEKANELNAPSLALALQLGLDTGQRAADLRFLVWANYNGTHIKLKQSKTDVWVEIPVMQSLKIMLNKAKSECKSLTHVLLDETTGKPYTRDRLCHRFRELCDAAGIEKSIQFRDLRRSCVVRLGEHGCTNAEIAAISGHSIDETAKILEVYLPRNKVMADNAIAKLEKVGSKQSGSEK